MEIVPSRYVIDTDFSHGPHVSDTYFLSEKDRDYWTPSTMGAPSNINLSSYIGRIPVNTLDEANKYVIKLLKYEKGIFTSPSYVNNFLMVDGFGHPHAQSGKMTDINTYCKTYRNKYTQYWYMFDHFACTKNDHENHSYDTTYGEELNRFNFLTALQDGRNWGDFHIVCHSDHSYPTNMGASQKDKGEYITSGDIDGLSDTSSKIIFSTGCNPAEFSKDCIAEHFLKKSRGELLHL